ncbi:oligomeric complex COG6 [Hysterangium stoloniferum]|nr:oligomeric complex COG6 [Hysterangium stoloniferum]
MSNGVIDNTPPPKTVTSPSSLDQRGDVPQSLAWNPISLRLYKVFGANYEDAGTREALDTLSIFYSTPPTTALSRDINEDDDSGNELYENTLEDAPHRRVAMHTSRGVAAKARKNLRRDTEVRLAEGSQKFLTAFSEVDEKLNDLEDYIQEMCIKCDEVETKLKITNDACKYLLDRAEGLRLQRQNMTTRQSIVSLFLSQFNLTEAESEAITSRDVPVGKRMFDAMERTEKIRDSCQVLLGGDGGSTNAGLDIMALTSSLLEQAYQKIFRWCSFEFRQLGRDAQLEVGPIMKESVRLLRKQPDLLSEALKSLSQTRQATLLTTFLDALTRGGPSGLPRPIEIHAHDPTRYVGDMLGWVHQAVAGEHEFLSGLFGVKSDGRMVGSVRTFTGRSEEEEWVRTLLDESVEKLCLPLKMRVQQTIRSQEGSITSYKIANILQFYLITMRRTIGEETLLSRTLKEITDLAYKIFFDAIEAQGRSLLRFLHPPDADLSAPLSLRDSSQVLREIMSVYDSSVLGDEDPEEQRRGFKRILDAAVDPALEMCRRMADMNAKDSTGWEKSIFLINCLDYLQSIMQPFAFTNERIEELEVLLQSHVKLLTEEHYLRLIQDSGLSPIVDATDKGSESTPLSHLPESSSPEVSNALRKFDSFLSTLDVLSSPSLMLLTVPRLATLIHRLALKRIGLAYGRICDEVKNPQNKYEFATTLLGSQRPFGQMNVLWQVLGVHDIE